MQSFFVSPELCNRSIQEFYELVAQLCEYTVTDNTRYNCAKIKVSSKIQDAIFHYYENNGYDTVSFGMAWLCYGPKAYEDMEEWRVVVEAGFFEEVQ